MRGLKHGPFVMLLRKVYVAPYTGAWIETESCRDLDRPLCVAPYTGAWIETMNPYDTALADGVAPYTGAWIETFAPCGRNTAVQRRTLHGCVD